MPNWAEQVTAIATAVSAIGLSARSARCSSPPSRPVRPGSGGRLRWRSSSSAAGAKTRWWRPVASSPGSTARGVAGSDDGVRGRECAEAYVLFRELDYFEQLGALEEHGGFDFELIRTLLGHRLIERWEMWQPAIDAVGGTAAYPMLERLVTKMRAAL